MENPGPTQDAADAANLEYGARNLLTLWGGDLDSDLAGYDGKIWAGLLKDVYGGSDLYQLY
jgi:hypothetical protein